MLLFKLVYLLIPPVHVYINRIDNRLVLKIKYGYNLELQTPETIIWQHKKNDKDTTKNRENVPSVEVVEVVLVQCI